MTDALELSLNTFIDKHVFVVSEKYKNASLSYFHAINSGKPEDYITSAQAELERQKIYTNKKDFNQIIQFKKTDINNPLLKRQIDLLFLSYQAKQADEKKLEKIIEIQNQIEQKFSTFRAKIDDHEYTDNQIENILSTSKDTEEVKKVWVASKDIGPIVLSDVMQIVKMRNEIAKEL